MFVLFDPANHPSQAVSVFSEPPSCLIAQSIAGPVLKYHCLFYYIYIDLMKGQLVKKQAFHKTQLFIGADL